MECPEWLAELAKNVTNCFETVGSIDWIWNEEEGEYEIKIFPVVMMLGDGNTGIHGDIRLDVADVLSYFDKGPAVMWHLTGNEEGAFHVEGTVNGIEVWLYFMETPPAPDIPVDLKSSKARDAKKPGSDLN